MESLNWHVVTANRSVSIFLHPKIKHFHNCIFPFPVWHTQRTETEIHQKLCTLFFSQFGVAFLVKHSRLRCVNGSRTAWMRLGQWWRISDDTSPELLSRILAKLCWTHGWVDKHGVSAAQWPNWHRRGDSGDKEWDVRQTDVCLSAWKGEKEQNIKRR